MIQRIQSLYLILAAICLFLTVFLGFSLYAWNDGADAVLFNIFGLEGTVTDAGVWFPYKFVIPGIAALCIFAVLQFKNRKLQMNICKILYLLLLALIVFLFMDVYGLKDTFTQLAGDADKLAFSPGVGMYCPVAALPLVYLANRRIKKDEDLVKSVDRLR